MGEAEVDLEKVEGRRARAAAWMNNQDPPEGAGERAAWLVITGDVPALIAELEQIRYARDQRVAEAERLGEKANELVQRATFERERANEAARLSAEARDQADDLRTEIGTLREQIEILEQDRLERDAWAVNLCTELDLYKHPYEVANEFGAIAARLRGCERMAAEHHAEFKQFERLRDEAIAEAEEVIRILREDLQRHSDARITDTHARMHAEQVQFTHSMLAYPHLFLWHALFDGTPLCRCWHSREMRGDRRALDGG